MPAVDGLLASVADRYPDAVRHGVPAHISVLYPFLAAHRVDGDVISTLRGIFSPAPAIPVTFDLCHRDSGFVFLPPSPADPLNVLTDDVRQAWPDVVPYDGVYGEVDPHLTIAMRTTVASAESIQREVTGHLPISAELREAWLVGYDGSWSVRERFSFRG